MCLHPVASHPSKIMDQLVPFLAPVDTDSAVLYLLSAEKEDSGADKWIQSAVEVCIAIFMIGFFSRKR